MSDEDKGKWEAINTREVESNARENRKAKLERMNAGWIRRIFVTCGKGRSRLNQTGQWSILLLDCYSTNQCQQSFIKKQANSTYNAIAGCVPVSRKSWYDLDSSGFIATSYPLVGRRLLGCSWLFSTPPTPPPKTHRNYFIYLNHCLPH